VEAILQERAENGMFISVFDVTSRVSLRACNKRVFESLVLAGGFDSFGRINRSQFFTEDSNGRLFLENVMKFGGRVQENKDSSQVSLFGGGEVEELAEPQAPRAEPWPTLTKLSKEKEVVGIYISGHPLDDFKLEIDSFCKGSVSDLVKLEENANQELRIAGIITDAQHRTTKHGNPFGTFDIEDYGDSNRLFVFGEDYMRFKHMIALGTFVYISGRIAPRKYGDGWEFKINTMDLLTELRDKRAKVLKLEVESSDITDRVIDDLYNVVMDHSGSCQLKFIIKDHKTNAKIKMPSKTMKVAIDNDFINKVKELEVFDYTLE